MKKSKLFILLTTFLLSGCCYVNEYSSLDEYKEMARSSKIGNSDTGIDNPEYFLPSYTFLYDFDYIDGNYYFYETCIFYEFCSDDFKPNRALITLKYDVNIYLDAKKYVLDNIPQYGDCLYQYNDYKFYINKKYVDFFEYDTKPEILYSFTMASYNDDNNTICFLGFCSIYPDLDANILINLDENFTLFIDQYYGEYYDFSK